MLLNVVPRCYEIDRSSNSALSRDCALTCAGILYRVWLAGTFEDDEEVVSSNFCRLALHSTRDSLPTRPLSAPGEIALFMLLGSLGLTMRDSLSPVDAKSSTTLGTSGSWPTEAMATRNEGPRNALPGDRLLEGSKDLLLDVGIFAISG